MNLKRRQDRLEEREALVALIALALFAFTLAGMIAIAHAAWAVMVK